jgi:hypothetical protein
MGDPKYSVSKSVCHGQLQSNNIFDTFIPRYSSLFEHHVHTIDNVSRVYGGAQLPTTPVRITRFHVKQNIEEQTIVCPSGQGIGINVNLLS